MKTPTMAIQLYTLRDYIKTAEDFDKTLKRLSDMGVRDVQISGIGDIPAETQRELLSKHNMKVCVTHKSFDWMKDDIDAVIAHHKTIGCDAVGIGSAPDEGRGNRGNVKRFICEAEEIAKKLKENGMTFNYHNHSFEFYRLDDHKDCMMEWLLQKTDPALFNFIPDVAWIHYAGADPVGILKRMKCRVKVLHFKDYIFDSDGNRHFVSLGKGVVDLKACFDAAKELEIPYIAYEQDNDWANGDAFKATEESWEFMQSLLKD
ncbi:MAG: sugar phosphate isomerase/epimerase [Oscillospiraceae bacterium]|nr:sugar phosphate isomerase/epimerase [Oscillospiraceae bacterium]